jgi:uncharacterized protein (DUF302 family)
MTTREKIEKRGYKVTSNLGYRDGEQTIVSYSAKKGYKVITASTLTELLRKTN